MAFSWGARSASTKFCANADTTLEIHDRLAHMGGLSGLYLRAAGDFLQALPAQLAALQLAANDTDSAPCAMQAHTLKGTAAPKAPP